MVDTAVGTIHTSTEQPYQIKGVLFSKLKPLHNKNHKPELDEQAYRLRRIYQWKKVAQLMNVSVETVRKRVFRYCYDYNCFEDSIWKFKS